MAASFDGVDDSYSLAGESTLRYEYTQAFSGHCWIRKDSVTGNCIMGKAQNSPPAADQRGWAFNTEAVGPDPGISFHLVNNASNHAFLEATGPVVTPPFGTLSQTLWVAVGFTYSGNGLRSGMTLYCNGREMLDIAGGADTLGGNTILVDGTPLRVGGFDTEFWAGQVAGIVIVPAELSAADMFELADIRNMYVDPDTFLGTAADVWLPLRRHGGVVDLTDYSGNGHDASIGSGAPAVAPDPTVVYDTFATTNFTTSTSWTHTPMGPVSAVCVMIAQNVSSSDLISAVTYGGVAMTRLPTNGFAQDTAGEPGAVYVYTLLSGVPQGAQTVAVTVASGTDAKTAWVVTVNSTTAVTVAASSKLEGDQTNPSVTLSTVADWVGMVMNICFSGQQAPSGLTSVSTQTKLGGGRDFGSQSAVAEMGNLSGASVASGWTATIEDTAMVAFALESRASLVSNPHPLAPLRAR